MLIKTTKIYGILDSNLKNKIVIFFNLTVIHSIYQITFLIKFNNHGFRNALNCKYDHERVTTDERMPSMHL